MMTRFFKSSTFYSEYLFWFYNKNPLLAAESYEVQYRALMDDCFGWADFWKTNLEATQDYVVEDVVFNCEPLQKAWARERGVEYRATHWMIDILSAQIAEFQPEIWMCHAFEIGPEIRKKIISNLGIKFCIGWDGIAMQKSEFFSGCDLVLSCSQEVVDFYRNAGIPSALFKLGFEKSILNKIDLNNVPQNEATFIGGLSMYEKGHNNRLDLLYQLSIKTNISLWLSGDLGLKPFARAVLSNVRRSEYSYLPKLVKSMPANLALSKRTRGSVYGLEMYKILAGSKIVINSHMDAAGGKVGNMRLFEATGVGAMLLTDNVRATNEIFNVENEVVCYENRSQCIDLVESLLANEEKRSMIAKAGQQHCLNSYTLADSINDFVRYHL